MPINAVLFDLDGTLFDTAPDIIDALNRVLQHHGRDTVSLELLRSRINGGSLALLGHTFNIDEHHPDFAPLKEQLLSHYADITDYKSLVFTGMPELLDYLDANDMPWGIVTNRYTKLAQPLVKHFGLAERAQCLVGADLVEQPKPDPGSLLLACDLLKINPKETLYVGDSLTDIQAAHAAGMTAMLALYGYIPAKEDPITWGADYYVNNPQEILECLSAIQK